MIFEKIKEIIVSELSVSPEEVNIDSDLASDLNADSLDAVELIMDVQDELD